MRFAEFVMCPSNFPFRFFHFCSLANASRREKGEVQHDASDYDSEEENEDGDLTVYECPGLAPVRRSMASPLS